MTVLLVCVALAAPIVAALRGITSGRLHIVPAMRSGLVGVLVFGVTPSAAQQARLQPATPDDRAQIADGDPFCASDLSLTTYSIPVRLVAWSRRPSQPRKEPRGAAA